LVAAAVGYNVTVVITTLKTVPVGVVGMLMHLLICLTVRTDLPLAVVATVAMAEVL
jgi:hypothetical protein